MQSSSASSGNAGIAKTLESLSDQDLIALRADVKWAKTRLDHQRVPPGDWWTIWLLLAGRGAGKTRLAAETLREWAWANPNTRWLVAAPTFADVKDVCFEGESGLLNVIPRGLVSKYNKTDLELILVNGTLIKGVSAEDPNRFRGAQYHGGWLDEFAAWQYAQESFDVLMFGQRLGKHPRLILTTTPKPKQIIRDLVAREGKDVTVTRASTYANIANLAPTFREQIIKYEGTQVGRQEIHAELIGAEENSIIKRSWFEVWPHDEALPYFESIVVSLDTAMTEETRDKKTDETDFTACTTWGLFIDDDGKKNILLLDCWAKRLGMPELITAAHREMESRYGEVKIMGHNGRIVPKRGKKPNLLIIEDKGSGISLRQVLAREGVLTYPYNPGRAGKLDRLHAVSHLFSNGVVWVPESSQPHLSGQPISWADESLDANTMGLISQICAFTGNGSLKHDDYVDSTTQALRYFSDRDQIRTSKKHEREFVEDRVEGPKRQNPYAA